MIAAACYVLAGLLVIVVVLGLIFSKDTYEAEEHLKVSEHYNDERNK